MKFLPRSLHKSLGALGLYLGLALVLNLGCGEKAGSRQADEAGGPKKEVSLAERTPAVANRPIEEPSQGYFSSDACLRCHESEHASWSVSWHRTMTQQATSETVAGRFDGNEFEFYGWKFRPEKKDGKFWLHVEGTQSERKFDYELVMTTGSHHMQKYWYPTGNGREIGLAPLVYLIESGRWIPEHAAFLGPTQNALPVREGAWNRGCNQFHATGARPGLPGAEEDKIDTRVSEFGISCEACHGPGETHVAEMLAIEAGEKDRGSEADSIGHPGELPALLSSQVCGQCHGAWTMKDAAGTGWSSSGHVYRPGDDLHETRQYLHGATDKHLLDNIHAKDSFWPDGEIRVAGREYNGLIKSPCFTHDLGDQKRLSCISCHDMHASTTRADTTWPNDQLGSGMGSNAACYTCHESYRDNLSEHTHHRAGSSGSSCYNCHMPHTSYGLLKAVRSHTITSPSVANSLETGRPNACNQCHLDQTLEWSATHLNQFYGHEVAELTGQQRSVAASVLWMTKGDAAQRAIMAWSLGWKDAQVASGTDWTAFYLTNLMLDDYDAVRYIAHRSLRSIRGFESVAFDHMKPAGQADRLMAEILSRWNGIVGEDRPTASQLLYDENGDIRWDLYQQLVRERDNRPLLITE